MSLQLPKTPTARSPLPRLGPSTAMSPSGLPLLSTPSPLPSTRSVHRVATNSGTLRTVVGTRSPSLSVTSPGDIASRVAGGSSSVAASPSRSSQKPKKPKRRLRSTRPRTQSPDLDDDFVDGDGEYVPSDNGDDDDDDEEVEGDEDDDDVDGIVEAERAFDPLILGHVAEGTVASRSRSGSGRRGLRRSRSRSRSASSRKESESQVDVDVGDVESPSAEAGAAGSGDAAVDEGAENENANEKGSEDEDEDEGELVWESYSSWESMSSSGEEDEKQQPRDEKRRRQINRTSETANVGSVGASPRYDLLPKTRRRPRSTAVPVPIPPPPPVPPPGAPLPLSSLPPLPSSRSSHTSSSSSSSSLSSHRRRHHHHHHRQRQQRGYGGHHRSLKGSVEDRCIVEGKVLVKCSDGKFRKKQAYPRAKALARVNRVGVDPEVLKERFKASARCRGTLPISAVQMLRSWFLEHCQRPYPSTAERKRLAQKAGLTSTQVTDWFTNKRRRIWKPYMTDLEKKAIASGTLKNRRKVRKTRQVRVMKSPPRRRTRSRDRDREPGGETSSRGGKRRQQRRTSSRVRADADRNDDGSHDDDDDSRLQVLSRENDLLKKEHLSTMTEQGDLLQNVLAKVRRAVNVHGSNPEMEDIIQTLLPPVKRSRAQLQMELDAVDENLPPEEVEEERRSALSHQPPRKRRKFREMQDRDEGSLPVVTIPPPVPVPPVGPADLTQPPGPPLVVVAHSHQDKVAGGGGGGGMPLPPPEIAAMMGMGFVISPPRPTRPLSRPPRPPPQHPPHPLPPRVAGSDDQ